MTQSSPIHIELELVRAKEADDAFAFRFTRQAYLVRGRQGAYETAEMPWSRELLRDLEECRRPDRDPDVVARVGDLLREFLSSAGWGGHEATIVDARASRRRVHLTIRSAAAELYALPWELLTLRADGQHVGALEHVLIRYAWPGTSTVEASKAEGTGRLLVAWSAAGGGVPAAEQTKAIQEATRDAGGGDVVVLEHASYGGIADALEAAEDEGRPFRALHLLCHGAEAGSTFGLSLDAEDGEGRPVVVDAGRLQQLLAPYAHDLRLVVVAACDGGNMGEPGNRIGSVAQRLHRAGLQCVVASRYPLSARGSTRIAKALYRALWQGETIERAVVAARSAAAREVTQLDWASLQLYARPEDGDDNAVLVPVGGSEPVAAVAVPTPASIDSATAVPVAVPPRGRPFPMLAVVIALLVVVGGIGAFVISSGDDEAVATLPAPAPAPERDVPPQEPATTTGADAEPGTSTGGDDGSGTGAGTTGAADGGEAPPSETRPRPGTGTKPKPPSRTKPRSACTGAIKEYLGDTIRTAPNGAYRVEIWVWEDGKVKLANCRDCGELQSEARSRLTRVRAATIQSLGTLPCRTSFEW